jgi:hypothetical protein
VSTEILNGCQFSLQSIVTLATEQYPNKPEQDPILLTETKSGRYTIRHKATLKRIFTSAFAKTVSHVVEFQQRRREKPTNPTTYRDHTYLRTPIVSGEEKLRNAGPSW